MMDAQKPALGRLVSRVVPLDKPAEETLAQLLQISDFLQIAVCAKERSTALFEGTLADGVMFERRLFHLLFATSDQKEGMDAFAQ